MTSLNDLQRELVPTGRRRVWLPSLGLRVAERKLLLGVVDLLLLNGALVLAVWLRTDLMSTWQDVVPLWKWFASLSVLWLLLAGVFDVYNLARAASTSYSLRASLTAALLTSLLYLIIPVVTPPIENRSQAYLFVLLSVAGIGTWRVLYALLLVQPAFQRRVLIVGAGHSGRAFVRALQTRADSTDRNPFRGTGYEVVGFVDDDQALAGQKAAEVPILGTAAQLVRLVRTLAVDELVVAVTNPRHIRPEMLEAILDCRELGVCVVNMTTLYERLTLRVPVEYASQDIEAATGSETDGLVRLNRALKRLGDLIGGAIGLVPLLLLAPVVWLANRLTAPGPLFYRQQRVGRGGKPFRVVKFRSMVPEAEGSNGAVWAADGDARVTPVGRWLRRTHLDELPQVLNVLRGEMSLVGPRPERPEFAGELARLIPFYRARHSVRPGLTGWAQIHAGYGDSLEAAQRKLEYDLYYVKHTTPVLDLLIILRTLAAVVGMDGR